MVTDLGFFSRYTPDFGDDVPANAPPRFARWIANEKGDDFYALARESEVDGTLYLAVDQSNIVQVASLDMSMLFPWEQRLVSISQPREPTYYVGKRINLQTGEVSDA